jgi:hypothetical protein
MSISLTAMFAATLYQVKASDADPASMDEAVGLLARAVNNRPTSFELLEGGLFVNDIPQSADAPGVSHVVKMLEDHGLMRLALPAGLEPRRWREIADVLTSVPALYPTLDDIRDALRASVPAAVVLSNKHESGITDLREELFEIPGLMTDAGAISSSRTEGLTTRSTDRSELSARLDPILRDASEAVAGRDFERLATLLLELAAIGAHSNEATRTILARERRRVVPQSIVETMVRLLPRQDNSPVITKSVMALGRDGVDALLEALSATPSAMERRIYIDALTASTDADEAILASLGSAQTELVHDAAEVAGRRRMGTAIPTLGHLLKHNDERVRTSAWQALEAIGTNEALAALYGDHGAGRSR